MARPLQLIALSLPPGGGSARRLLEKVDRLQASASIRVLDLILVSKDPDGTVVQSSFGDDDFGELISRLFPLGGATEAPGNGAPAELWGLAGSLPAGTRAAFLLVEHRWAGGIFDLIEEEGGKLLSAGFLTPELGLMIDTEITARDDAAGSIAAAQAAEADAWLRAATAQYDAAEAVADSTRIVSFAAAETVRVLTDAGLVEMAAVNEAADALSAADLIVAAADEATGAAIAQDVQRIAVADAGADEAIAEDVEAVTAADETVANVRTAASITPAELRVLRYLPTRLNFALIGDKLGISRGAAKNRAERAYQRLGVHTRVDAVARARELRLIPAR